MEKDCENGFKLNVDFSALHRCVEQMGAGELDEPFSVKSPREERGSKNKQSQH
ncbi:hypothetical protein [Alcanivorax sp.]|uniref:hypothetical protein n=1 Tax=Alcanivorax sp. TaxID=1872427 RepID=UPI00258BF8E4|nr:hypothetical protein [Alcanivorax sp.]